MTVSSALPPRNSYPTQALLKGPTRSAMASWMRVEARRDTSKKSSDRAMATTVMHPAKMA